MRRLLPLLLLISCSDDQQIINQDYGLTRSLLEKDVSSVDVRIIDWLRDEPVQVDASASQREEMERRQRCWQTQMFYCTPTGAPPGDDPTLYQQAMVIDVCDENGQPCESTDIADESCQWRVIDMGDCEEWLECDPTSDNVMINEDVPCVGTDQDGVEYTGVQDFVCQKGRIISFPCEPCDPESCDGQDNDCDTRVDEGRFLCNNGCEFSGTAYCFNGELVGCDAQAPFAEECNGLDDDCDGLIDEELVQQCETDCEAGVSLCVEGAWSNCTAKQPAPEECNGVDDNCDGFIDEGLQCACPPEMIGFLVPCMEDPLTCGQGFKTCECADEECSTTIMTECLAMCVWMPRPDEVCDPTTGMPIEEICNNFDDDCDGTIDEGLVAACYSGPEGTLGVGICSAGELYCKEGAWGSDVDGGFVVDVCAGEVNPLEEDLCTGNDDNCDGVIDKEMQETDILFIVDTSGSMDQYINAVQSALTLFSAHYSDDEVIQWALAVGPVNDIADQERLLLRTNLVPFDQFLLSLVGVQELDGGADEMLYDAIYLSIRNLAGALPAAVLSWTGDVSSSPAIPNWRINWRPDAHHVVIVFSDEQGQTYMNPGVTQQVLIDTAMAGDDLFIYSFSNRMYRGGAKGWEPVSVFGSWSELSRNSNQMFGKLMHILDETACGESEQGASRVVWKRFVPANKVDIKLEHVVPQGAVNNWIHLPTRQCIHPFMIESFPSQYNLNQ